MSDKLKVQQISMGCDPEFFFKYGENVVESGNILPEDGLAVYGGKIVIDGVQAELNPNPSFCRQLLQANILNLFAAMKANLAVTNGIEIDLRQGIKLRADEMLNLSDKSKKFGCMPSFNAHKDGAISEIGVDPAVYEFRSAGGHIHLGALKADANRDRIVNAMSDPNRIIKVLDAIVGNTSILFDRSESNIERRKVYGRAGEYRVPPHGIEYRTPSNFWLKHPALMSMVFGLSRLAVLMVADNKDEPLWKLVHSLDVEKAINDNDFERALYNFNAIKQYLLDITPTGKSYFDITTDTIGAFEYLIKNNDFEVPGDVYEHWLNEIRNGRGGFGSYLNYIKEKYL